ncbi:hypothetical protein [Pseudoduganella sp. R-34]|uniref:hypothetical protein n=1 Tax=Pseudoduganella sp. R-34 TaxID=3404062 RepID=UPI003CF767EA
MEQKTYPFTLYFASYRKPGKATWIKTRWRLTPEDWAKHFGSQEYRIEEHDKLVIRGPSYSPSTAAHHALDQIKSRIAMD